MSPTVESLVPWFKKAKKAKPVRSESPSKVPEGLWIKCVSCNEAVYSKEKESNHHICPRPNCGHHFRMGVEERLRLLMDDGWEELYRGVEPDDPLQFQDTKLYRDRLKQYQRKLGLHDAAHVIAGSIEGRPVIVAIMNYAFMGGSMGSVVGEKITLAAEEALRRHVPLIVISASGGARMQEGILSLMQMAKISAALAHLRSAKLPYISILTDPTTGGVTASFAMLGDLNFAEPGALIGFAGPRVIEQTIRESLPEGFQTAEFLLEKGFLDQVVPRTELKATLARSLQHLTPASRSGAA
ncbi:MAG: acetyl-CoA carboxylase, carboxyltransferase subunit beta [Acidobacteriota bacterium]